ncbi:MAG: formylglycine-generating enzyme family protein [Planctomycetota bacterium]|nr:formylglycine-generating enzyme family protein [Planctomycetota bacterium]
MTNVAQHSAEASTGNACRGFFASMPIAQASSRLSVLTLLVSCCAAGCGGSSTPQPTSAQPTVQQSSSDSRPVGFAQRVQDEPEPTADFSGVDPNDMFAVATSAPPNFLTTGTATDSRLEDRFVASINSAAGSSQFLMADRPRTQDATREVAEPLPAGFTAVPGSPIVDGRPSQITCDADQSEMVLIPAGESVIGTSTGPQSCTPEVSVSLSPFYISVLEVNVSQFSEFRSRSIKSGNVIEKSLNVDAPADHPALGVAWVEARAYAKSTDRELPSECQWEKAARGAAGLSAPWGNGRPLWSLPRAVGQIDSCGTFPDDRSVFGVVDMAGNAREWLLDFYSETNHQDLAAMDSGRRTDWSGPRRASESGQRVVKGDGPEWAVWFRRGQRMTERNPNVGFRCVLNLTAGATTEQ